MRIERVRGAEVLHAGNDWTDAGISSRAFAFKAIDPLSVVFDPLGRAQVGGASFGYRTPRRASVAQHDEAAAKSIVMQLRTNGCRSVDVSVAGDWDWSDS